MNVLRIFMLVLAIIALQAEAAQRNLTVNKGSVQEQKRIALVIGNAAYHGAPALRNSVNDAHAMSNALNSLGFEVIEVTDATQKEMNRAITAFGGKLNTETAALFFYAGHGMQVRGKNYIIPVDAQIETEAAVASESVSVDTVLEQLNVSTISIVILDACRNNPFERSFRKMGGGGLAQMDAPKGSFIAYATSPGKTAADGDGKNGLFTQELLKQIKEPGLTLELVFKRVRSNVATKSGDAQMPWDSSSMTGEFYFKPGTKVASLVSVSAQQAARGKTKDEIEDEYWEEIKGSTDPEQFEQYRKAYPEGRYINTAKLRIDKLSPKPVELPKPVAQVQSTVGEPVMIRIPGKNYEMGKYEVTQKGWREVMGNNPSSFTSCGDTCPVEKVSWNDIQEFLQKLNSKTGKQYRLPYESEWEYACYGGSQTEYCGGSNLDAVGWYKDNSGGTTHPVGQKQANGYGLYDMTGNVWEWMENKYDVYDYEHHWLALRGGSWSGSTDFARAAIRYNNNPDGRNDFSGFRVARTLP